MLMNWGMLSTALLLLTTAFQLYYYFRFFRRVARYRPPDEANNQQHPVSVIVCARDEFDALVRHLPSVLEQHYPSTHEVIVVNDNSLDESKYILADLQKTYRKLQIVELAQEAKHIQGKKYPLSIGIREAKHEIMLLTDADCRPASEDWLYRMQDAFRPGVELVLGYGAYARRGGLLNRLIRFETFHTAIQYFGYALAGKPYMGVGRNLAYRKDLFYRHKGFSSINHIPSGDDDLFVNRAATRTNTAVLIHPDAFTVSEPKKTWKEWMRQKQRHYTTGKYYKKGDKALLGLYTASYFLFYPLVVATLFTQLWYAGIALYLVRLIVQGRIWKGAMQRLGEDDLYPYYPLLDLWMFFYYILFAPTLWKKPRKNWQ